MRKILDIRSRLAKESDVKKLKELKEEADRYRVHSCHFRPEKDLVSDLIDDIEIKIELIEDGMEIEKIYEKSFPKSESKLIESIIPSTNCTLFLEENCSLREIEREAIRVVLLRNSNNRTATARELKISVRTLRNKLNEYLLNDEVSVYELSRVC